MYVSGNRDCCRIYVVLSTKKSVCQIRSFISSKNACAAKDSGLFFVWAHPMLRGGRGWVRFKRLISPLSSASVENSSTTHETPRCIDAKRIKSSCAAISI